MQQARKLYDIRIFSLPKYRFCIDASLLFFMFVSLFFLSLSLFLYLISISHWFPRIEHVLVYTYIAKFKDSNIVE